jgi:transcriptional regulator with XRE-family HTH domain
MESRIPNKLRSYRRCFAYSQKKVARMLGLSGTSVLSKWETGVSMPDIVQVFRLARLYQTEPHLLYEDLWDQSAQDSILISQSDIPFKSNQSFYV